MRGEDQIARGLGQPALFAIAASAIGSSLYYILGVVAGQAQGLTPLVFAVGALFFVLTMLTYVEGNSLHPERGGAAVLARYAFNELWSFVAGWAILLDFLIVLAIGAVAVPHYLGAFWGEAADGAVGRADLGRRDRVGRLGQLPGHLGGAVQGRACGCRCSASWSSPASW